MATKTKTRQSCAKDDIIGTVLDHLENYLSASNAIMQDYVADPGMCMELAEAEDKFRRSIEDIDPEEESFNYLVDKLKDLPEKEVDLVELLDVVDNINSDAIRDYLDDRHKGAVVIRVPVQTMEQQKKLEAFIKEHIYPHYNDQVANLDF